MTSLTLAHRIQSGVAEATLSVQLGSRRGSHDVLFGIRLVFWFLLILLTLLTSKIMGFSGEDLVLVYGNGRVLVSES